MAETEMRQPMFSGVLLRLLGSCALLVAAGTRVLPAQGSTSARSTLTVRVAQDSTSIPNATVRSEGVSARSDTSGVAALRLPPGPHVITINKLGFRPETLSVQLRADRDTSIAVSLVEEAARVSPIMVTSTRVERRLEEEPLRIEVLSGDDVTEKNEMRPADLRNLLVEMSGVRIQATSASLGAAALRLQGLPGRYALVLDDGLPLYGAQSSGFGLVQMPPLDLRQAEVIKGASSALYGPSALSGVVNLVSRRPPDTSQVLVNQTFSGGTDLLGFDAHRLSPSIGVTVLGGAHQQRAADTGHDGWSDIPAVRRIELRPRFFFDDSAGRSLMATVGGFAENRSGGVIGTPSKPVGIGFADSLSTQHGDVGAVGRWQLNNQWSVGLRSSANLQDRHRRIGASLERERQSMIFSELTATMIAGPNELVSGVAWQRSVYSNRDVPQFDQVETTPGVFIQHTLTATSWLSTTVNVRCDGASSFGTICSPRASLLVHEGAELSARLSAGAGWFAPMVLNEETEVIGLSHIAVPQPLAAERAGTLSLDVTATRGPLQVNGTLFSNRVTSPVGLRPFALPSGDTMTLAALVNGPGALRTWGGEVFAVFSMEPIIATAYVASTRSRELSAAGLPRELPLTPSTDAGVDVAYEEDETGTYVAGEVFYTGRQSLENDPYRQFGAPYATLGLLASQRIKRATFFLNVENLTDVRLSRYEPVIRPSPGEGGRLTVDPWAPLEGRLFNLGVRYAF